jgi:class 3 adenylate cyclase
VADRPAHAAPPGADGGATVRTFLLADFHGYTRFTRQHGDDAASELAARFAELVGDVADRFGG